MSGIKYLLDTCFVIQWHAHNRQIFEIIKWYHLRADECAYSDIAYAEVFGFQGITDKAERELHFCCPI
ncbi:hypothetical protein [Lonepinella koalarum]|uniref:hypothetical protein n=1 Tax=Lonepinella koalarum TaxID=53417 RepID=UPI001402C0BE|nr:hypothetical protein [Lonepinella koalarum]MDH2926618.1 hypothetical protein [Lonepinella koalarum]